MHTRFVLLLVLGMTAASAGKPPAPCVQVPGIVYVANDPNSYGLRSDNTGVVYFDGDVNAYSRYEHGVGGVEAYVNTGPNCAGTFFFNLNGARRVNLRFTNWLNNGVYGPPKSGSLANTETNTVFQMYLRGFTFVADAIGDSFTTIFPANYTGTGMSGGGVRWESTTNDFLTANPSFPTGSESNTPCETSKVRMTVLSPTETLVEPDAAACGNYNGPVSTVLGLVKGGGSSMRNVGQFGINFRMRIVVPALPRF